MAQRPGMNLSLSSVDELFGGAMPEADTGRENIVSLPISELHHFKDHPFSVVDDKEMQDMAGSIKEYGVLTPAIVRPRPEGGYELVSGHRRKRGSELAGIETLPCIVREMDDNTAIILMVDSNFQRENVKPSEKAKALQMKMTALRRKNGRPSKENSVQVERSLSGKETRQIVAEQAGESVGQVQRLLRLNELAPELLEKVDKSELALTPAVELSYLPPEEQKQVAELIDVEGRTPSLSQAQQIKKLSQEKKLDDETLGGIFIQQKPQERRTLTLKGERLEKFYTDKYTPAQFEDIVFKALTEFFQRQRNKERKNEEMGTR